MNRNRVALFTAIFLAGCNMLEDAQPVAAGSASEAQKGDGSGTIELAEYPDRPYWGDTHLHTALSLDAYGNRTILGPERALQFASGQRVPGNFGRPAQIDRPLDFLVIADHAENLGIGQWITHLDDVNLADPTLKRWHAMMQSDEKQSAMRQIRSSIADGTAPDALMQAADDEARVGSIWERHLDLLDRYNKPGEFTALAGFEWSLAPQQNSLHRVVLFQDGSAKTGRVLPLPATDDNVELLWDYMEEYEQRTGGRVLAIPHNPNLSNGMMFALTGPDGGAMTADYARRRALREPIIEVTQIKGDSETHPLLSPNDEMAGFGVAGWELGNADLSQRATPGTLAGSYVRSALLRGLTLDQRIGVNPYAFGMIGSTDNHFALSTTSEQAYQGESTGFGPDASRATRRRGPIKGRFGWHDLAGGYAAVWARGNTRAEIFAAFRRREVYATTGTRMTVRLFAGFDFTAADWDGDWVRAGYSRGVPMGGELVDLGRAPVFLLSALKDPEGANLDRIQIVKGWVDADGKAHERVYDAAWSDMEGRRARRQGKVPPVGDTVDRSEATYDNSIGAPALNVVWTDPDYRRGERAFYYARVLEIPTPSWVLFDARRAGIDLPRSIAERSVIQERAYSSPVWLSPAKKRD